MSFQFLYPSTIGNGDNSLYLNFTCYDYKNAKTGFSKRGSIVRGSKFSSISNFADQARSAITQNLGFFANIGDVFPQPEAEVDDDKKKANPFTLKADEFNKVASSNTKELLGSISLYLPPKIESKYGADWQKMQFGALGAGFKEDGGIDLGGVIGAAGATGASYLLDLAKSFLQNTPQVENLTLNGLVGATLGVSFNDNTIQTFNKMNPRTFEFEYIMIAKNKTDVANIKAIIREFKRSMHPSAKNNRNQLILSYPFVWRITPTGYRNKNAKAGIPFLEPDQPGQGFLDFIPKTDLCGLVDMKVDYTPDNNISLNQAGFVQAVRLNLSFIELITLTREDIDQFNY